MRSPLSPDVLQYLVAITELGSIRRAAERLNISPSALNRQILNLEQRIGTRLFDREARGMKPTRSGEIILAAAKEFERSVTEALEQVGTLRGLGSGRVSFGTLTTFAETFTGPLVVRIRKQHPQLRISYYSGNSADIVHKVLEGNLDFGLCWDPPMSTPISCLVSVEVPVGVAMRPDHPLAKKSHVRLRDCLEHPVVFPSRGMEFRSVLDRINVGIGNVISPAIESNSIAFLRRICVAGGDPVMMTANSVLDEIESGALAFRPLSDPSCGQLMLSLFKRDGAATSAASQALLDALRAEVSDLQKRFSRVIAKGNSARARPGARKA